MAQHGSDPLTTQRATQIFNVEFLIVSKLGVDAASIISPCGYYCENLPLLVPGHSIDGHGDNYVCLSRPITPLIDSILEIENEGMSSPSHPVACNLTTSGTHCHCISI